MQFKTALALGRVSNLPSVWTNCLAGALLAGASLSTATFAGVGAALSLMYLGGMFLNDACDANWDARHKPERPIPAGLAGQAEVWGMGLALLAAGPMLLLLLPLPGAAAPALTAAALLATTILAYDWMHKRVSFSPWLMGACRGLAYVCAGLALGEMSGLLLAGAAALMAYIVGLTYVARSEHLNHPGSWWPLPLLISPLLLATSQVPAEPVAGLFAALLLAWLIYGLRALLPGPQRDVGGGVGRLLAGIPLVDACALGAVGHWPAGSLAVLVFAVTLWLQRRIAAT